MNVGKVLAHTARVHPDKTAVICGRETLSFSQLNLMANRVGNKLAQEGIKRGDRIAVMLPNSSHFAVAYYGVTKRGAVCVPLEHRFKESELKGIVEDARIEGCITSKEAYDKLAPFLKRLERTPLILLVGGDSSGDPGQGVSFEETIDDEGLSQEASVEVAPDEEALYLYSSGTTGRPKGIILTFSNLSCFPEVMGRRYGTSERDVVGCVLPMSHISGPVLCNELVDKGCTLVIFDQLRPDKVLDAISQHGVTWFHAVPPIFQSILRVPHLDRYDIGSLRFVALMGTSVPLDLLKSFRKVFPSLKVIQGYGLTETSPLITLMNAEDFQRKMGSIGVAVPRAEIRLVSGHGQDVPVGEIGELIVRGPMVMKGYHNNADETREKIRDGWLYTGDLCTRDEEGFYYYLGRKDDMIIVGGFNVFPAEVENVLLSHPRIREAAVIGVADKERGAVVKSFVVLESGSALSEKEVIVYCRQRMASYKVPKIVEFRDTISKTSTGKIARGLLAGGIP